MMCSLYSVPAEWRNVKLKEVATIIMGQSPPSSTYNETGEGLPFLQGKAKFGLVYPKPQKYTTKPLKIAEKGDILIAVRAPVGDVNIAPYKIAIGRGLAAIRPKTNKVDTFYLFYYLQFIKPYLENLGKGSTFKAITKRDLENLTTVLPPLDEQRKIARILYTVDEVIAKTDTIISRVEELRRALLDYLMTHGVGHREYKETEIGKIPRKWKIVKLSSVARIIMGQSPPSSTYNDKGIGLPFMQGKAEFGRIYPSPKKYTSRPLKIAEKGDILIAVRAPVGDVNIAPYKLCIGRGLAAIRPVKDVNTLFLFYYLIYAKPRLEAKAKGSTFKAITKTDLEGFLVPIPPLDEQEFIGALLYNIDLLVISEEKRKVILQKMKEQLMNLLLTGKVRVKDLPID